MMQAYLLFQSSLNLIYKTDTGLLITSGNYRNFIRIRYGREYNDTIDYGLKLLGGLAKDR
jgi:hypothetical protein